MKKQRLVKIAGYGSTLAVFIIGIAPATFNIPSVLHPWLLLLTVVWIVCFSSGVFSS